MEVLVSQLEREAHQLEQDGDDIRAIRMMERALAQRIAARMQGSIPAAERLVVKYNTVAVRCFKNDDFDAAETLLNSALELTTDGSIIFLESDGIRVKLRGTTFNNFGCLERRRGDMSAAATYLKQSIEHAGQESPASFLNLSAVLTHLGRYTDAVAWSRRAIAVMEIQATLTDTSSSKSKKQQQAGEAAAAAASAASSSSDSPGLMAIAYHNLASPLEQLDRAAAIAAYRKALEIARAEIGINSSTTRSIQASLDRFLRMAPTQVTAASSPQAAAQFAGSAAAGAGGAPAAAGGMTDPNAIPTSSARKNQLPAPNTFLPPMAMGGGGRVPTTQDIPTTTDNSRQLAMANTPRGRAMALAAARRKGGGGSGTMTPTVGGGSRGTSPTQFGGVSRSARPSPRGSRLSPIDRRRGSPSGSTPPSSRGGGGAGRSARSPLLKEELKAREESAKERMLERTRKAEERRDRVAAARSAKVEQLRMEKQERMHSRTPPPVRGGGDQKRNDREREEQKSHSARKAPAAGRSTMATASGSGLPPRRTTSPATTDDESSQPTTKRREPKPPAPAAGDRRRSTPPSRRSSAGAAAAAARGGAGDDNKAESKRGGRRDSASQRGGTTSAGTTGTSATTSDRNRDKQFTRKIEAGSGSGNPVKDLEEEISKKDDIVSFMVARLAALLRAEEDFERCYIAVCRIQCLFRRIRAKVRVQEMRRERQIAIIYRQVRENSAARAVVRFFRDLVAKKQEAVLAELRNQEILDMNNKMASKMQRMSRMWLAKRDLSRRKDDALRHSKALRCLQCFFRKHLAKKKLRMLRTVLVDAQQLKLTIERKQFAAAQIQRVFLGRRDALKIHRMRRTMRLIREKELESRRTASSKRIQAAWRGFLGRCKASARRAELAALRKKIERWELIHTTVLKLQSWCRGVVVRIRAGPELADFRRRQQAMRAGYVNNAATKINSSVRGFLARRRCSRMVVARTAAQRHDWGVFLLPRFQAFVRGRLSAAKVARRLLGSLEGDVAAGAGRRAERFALCDDEVIARQAMLDDEVQPELEALLRWRATDSMRATGATMRREEEEERERHEIIAEAARRLKEQQELAAAGPIVTDVRKKGQVSNELKLEQAPLEELDEDAEHSTIMQRALAEAAAAVEAEQQLETQVAQMQQQQQRDASSSPTATKAKKLRGPFYTTTDSSSSPTAAAGAGGAGYASTHARGLSTKAREELRKLELKERMAQKMREQEAEEEEHKRVLAAASGMRSSVATAIERTKAVVAEPILHDEPSTTATAVLFEPRQEQPETSSREASPSSTSPSRSATNSLKEHVVAGAEQPQFAWEDFSKLDSFTTAHRDEVLNAITRRSVTAVQALLRQRLSAAIADARAARFLKKLPELQKSASTVAAFLSSLPAVSELQRREQVTVLGLQSELTAVSSTRQAVNVIQASAAAQLDADHVRMLALAKFQEMDVAASRIQAVVRERQERKDGKRRDRLARENLRRRAAGTGAVTAGNVEEHVRDYAARRITTFLRHHSGKTERRQNASVLALRQQRHDRTEQLVTSAKTSERLFAVAVIHRAIRFFLKRRAGAKQRARDLKRRRQLLVVAMVDGEELYAVRIIQVIARLYLLRLARRQKLAQRRVPEAAQQIDFERNYAATRIQSVARGRAARRRRQELEREKARKWAGLLDEEIEKQRSQSREASVEQQQQHQQQQVPSANAVVGDHDDDAAAATRIQCAYRSKAARARADELRVQKKKEWDRLAQEEEL